MQCNSNKKQKPNPKQLVTDYGTRQISRQNFSRIVALPLTALRNIGDIKKVNVKLVQDENGEQFLKLSPIKNSEEQ